MRVLVIGGASDTGTVLKAVLEPRGATVVQRRFRNGIEFGPTQSDSKVVVIDVDNDPDAAADRSYRTQCHRVLIGSDLPERIQSTERFLAKPFQYPELVRAIEDLLNQPSQ